MKIGLALSGGAARGMAHVGVLRALEGHLQLGGARVVIFGAGGSARAAAFALTNAGAEVLICARREWAARELARACGAQVIATEDAPHGFVIATFRLTNEVCARPLWAIISQG